MKGSVIAAAAFAGSVLAEGNLHRRHEAIHQKRAVAASGSASASASASPTSSVPLSPPDETCGCTTKVITLWGSPTLVPIPQTSTVESTSTLTSTVHSTSTKTATVTVTPSVAPTSSVAPASSAAPSTSTVIVSLPTNGVTSYSTTGTYTVPATTMTVTDTTTVCGATTTAATSGTHTIGEVTTVVSTETTVTCPYATVKPSGTTVTSVIEYTTYTCPAAGTYTVVPGTTTVVPSDTTIVYPTPSTIAPGTYTKPETTLTVTETDTTYYCPFASSTGLASTTAAAPTTVAPAPASTTAAVVASSTSSAAQSTGTSSSGLTGSGKYGMTFSPYTDSGNCMTQSEVTKNIKIISEKGFDLVRVYSTDCNGLEYIGNACKEMGMSMILGVYIESTGTSGAQEQVDAINKWAQWDMVKLIVVGNEAVSSGYVTAAQLASFISSSKSSFKSAGYTGQVTTTEPIDIWQQYGSSTLCSPVDIVGANIHPFFNADTTAAQAGEFALSEYKILEKICNLDVLNLETGWPNAGDANGAAVPGVSEQETAIKGIAEAIGSKSIFFSYADDAWKAPGEFQVENHWGCKSVF
ncbi:beta-glucosidase btgE [Penicillium angulare]|uniref:beta-glucosidase btgE n=1 Tax=Penicillium angulare TaxID=116970 RepID=UPI0025425E47|nr:beta-glucosidase btgE [Penicillium angulare]KAJ5290946.1 beta-glucosidase btgE [Penicillium angulare]